MIRSKALKQVFCFACVGLVATAIHYSSALFVVDVVGLNLLFANIFGYVAAVFVSLYGHSIFTYKKSVNSHIANRFVTVSLSTLIVSESIVIVLEYGLGLHHRITLAIVVLIIPIVTFFLNKFWVYTDKR